MDSDRLKKTFSNIKVWIGIFFVVRLIGITNAPLETGHNWRQSLTNMIARNFYEYSPNIFYPQIDIAGSESGIIGSEFPFFNYLIYLVSLLFGYGHWYGRLINLAVSSIGVYYFYKLLKPLFNKEIAFNSTLILLSSIWFAFSRKIMPDTFSVSLVIIGLYHAYLYLNTGNLKNLTFYFLLATLGVLIKIPALTLLSFLAIPVLMKQVGNNRKSVLILTTTLSVIIMGAWYFYWVPYLVRTYHFELYFPKSITEGIKEILEVYPLYFQQFYFSALHSYFALIAVIGGLFLLIKTNQKWVLVGLSISTAVFVVFTIKTGAVFPTHNYYIIPFVPIMAFVAGFFLQKIPNTYKTILLTIIILEGVVNQQHDLFINDSELYKLKIEHVTHKYIPKNKLVVVNGGPGPQLMYFAHTKGWTFLNSEITLPKLQELQLQGAEYLILDKHNSPNQYSFDVIYSDSDFSILKL